MSWLYLSKPCAFLHYPLHTELAGAASARPSLRPPFKGEQRNRKPRANRVARMSMHVPTSLRAKRPVYACCASGEGSSLPLLAMTNLSQTFREPKNVDGRDEPGHDAS